MYKLRYIIYYPNIHSERIAEIFLKFHDFLIHIYFLIYILQISTTWFIKLNSIDTNIVPTC